MSLAFCGLQEIAAGATDNTVRVWDLTTKIETSRLVGHTGSVTSLAYSEGTLASAGYDTVVRIWLRNRNVAREVESNPRRVGQQTRGLRSR